jgi:hypothetical protein
MGSQKAIADLSGMTFGRLTVTSYAGRRGTENRHAWRVKKAVVSISAPVPDTRDYCAFVPVVNRPDLLEAVVHAAEPLWDALTIIDNSPERWVREWARKRGLPVSIFVPPVPLSFAQTQNWMLRETIRRGKPIYIFMHSDAIIPGGACEKLLDLARFTEESGQRWGAIFTHYDVLAAFNPRAFEDVGGWDTNLPWYYSDNDVYRRLKLAGWQCIDSNIQVGHDASQTLNSDSYLRFLNRITFPLFGEYYRRKWGGKPGEETFIHPFGVLPKEWEIAKAELNSV